MLRTVSSPPWFYKLISKTYCLRFYWNFHNGTCGKSDNLYKVILNVCSPEMQQQIKKGRKVAFHSFLLVLFILHWVPTVSLKNIHNKLSFMYLISQTSIFYKREWVVEYVCTKEKYVWKRSADLCQVHCIHQTNHLSPKGDMLFRNNLNTNNRVGCYLVNLNIFGKIIYFGN